jgi:hypothetical protein
MRGSARKRPHDKIRLPTTHRNAMKAAALELALGASNRSTRVPAAQKEPDGQAVQLALPTEPKALPEQSDSPVGSRGAQVNIINKHNIAPTNENMSA